MSNARGVTLLFLRISLGLLMIVWGADKLVNPAHGIGVAERFYFGLMSSASLMPALGIAEILLGLMVIAGILRNTRTCFSPLSPVSRLLECGARSLIRGAGTLERPTRFSFRR